VSLYSHIRRVEPDFLMGFGAWLGTISTGGAGGGGKPKAMWRRYGTYSIDNYVNDETGTPLVHEILRMEDLATLPAWLEGRGIPIAKDTEVRQVNAFAHSPQAFYTHRTIAQVARLYADDIARFGYAYEP
jgi:hypothetical protein